MTKRSNRTDEKEDQTAAVHQIVGGCRAAEMEVRHAGKNPDERTSKLRRRLLFAGGGLDQQSADAQQIVGQHGRAH